MTALYIIPILLILVLVHEVGHFVAARLIGVHVHEFGIGLPPKIAAFRRNGILYSLNAFPIGGFVRLLGEDAESDAPDSLLSKSGPRRAFCLAAGSLMNLLLAVAVVTLLVAARGGSTTHVYLASVAAGSPAEHAGWQVGDQLVRVSETPVTGAGQFDRVIERSRGVPVPVTLQRGAATIQTTLVPRADASTGASASGIEAVGAAAARVAVYSVQPDSPAEQAGLQRGDELLSAAGSPIGDTTALVFTTQRHRGEVIPLLVRRDGRQIELQLRVPESTTAEGVPVVGFLLSERRVTHPLTWWKAVPQGITRTVSMVRLMVGATIGLFQGQSPVAGLVGPIGMGQLTSEVLSISPDPAWVTLANITVLLSLNLALMNLLPFPALDGGRLLFLLIERVRGKRLPPGREHLINVAGLAMLLGVMLVAAFFDIGRLVSGQSLIRWPM